MEKFIAYCGLRCDTCPVYLLTLEQDFEKYFACLMKKAVNGISLLLKL